QSVGQRRVDEVLVRRHAGDVGRPPSSVDLDHPVETADVEAGDARGLARSEEVGRLLGQPDRLTCGDGGIRRAQSLDCLRVLGPGTSPGSHGSKIARPPETVSARSPESRPESRRSTRTRSLAAASSRRARRTRAWITVSSRTSRCACEPPIRAAYGSNRRRVSAALAWSPSTNAASPLASKGSDVAYPGASKPRALSAKRRRPSASPAVARASAACMPRNVNGTP